MIFEQDRAGLRAELRGLRKGTGLTLAKMLKCELLMIGLQTVHPEEAVKRLVQLLRSLGTGMPYAALPVAYNMAPDIRLGTLTARRAQLAAEIGMHVDTVKNYENETIEEIIALLVSRIVLNDVFLRDNLIISATINRGRIVNLTEYSVDTNSGDLSQKSHFKYNLPYAAWPGVIYYLPDDDGRMENLTLSVTFESTPEVLYPKNVWSTTSSNISDVLAGKSREIVDSFDSELANGTVPARRWATHFDRPQPGNYFAMWWEY